MTAAFDDVIDFISFSFSAITSSITSSSSSSSSATYVSFVADPIASLLALIPLEVARATELDKPEVVAFVKDGASLVIRRIFAVHFARVTRVHAHLDRGKGREDNVDDVKGLLFRWNLVLLQTPTKIHPHEH